VRMELELKGWNRRTVTNDRREIVPYRKTIRIKKEFLKREVLHGLTWNKLSLLERVRDERFEEQVTKLKRGDIYGILRNLDRTRNSKKIRTREKPGPKKNPDSSLRKSGFNFWKPGLEIWKYQIWSYFLSPRTILAAKYCTSCSFFTFC
jgi:DNA primase catalytic subunit